MDCHFCHQHKVNGPAKATCAIRVAILGIIRPCCSVCRRKYENGIGGSVVSIELLSHKPPELQDKEEG
jgi:hypothetical protein